MKRVLVSSCSVIILVILVIACIINPVYAYDPITVVFSDIGARGTLPALLNQTSITGYIVGGQPVVKLTDIANVMGASISVTDYNWYITRTSQTTTFTSGFNDMYTINSYSYYDPVYSCADYYSFSGNTECGTYSLWINGIRYVPLKEAALQMGALLAEPYNGTYRIYDFRINGSTPKTDSNDYIVGGSWITGWSSTGSVNLSDHFDRDEIWSSTSHGYARQMKIAATMLESAERVRYYYNNNSSMWLSCAFRSYAYNNSLNGSGARSYHMRGRAWDCDTDALYYSVYNEFRSGYTYPIDAGSHWRTRVPSTGSSRGYEIEKMPQYNSNGVPSTWLHLQREPGYDTPDAP